MLCCAALAAAPHLVFSASLHCIFFSCAWRSLVLSYKSGVAHGYSVRKVHSSGSHAPGLPTRSPLTPRLTQGSLRSCRLHWWEVPCTGVSCLSSTECLYCTCSMFRYVYYANGYCCVIIAPRIQYGNVLYRFVARKQ